MPKLLGSEEPRIWTKPLRELTPATSLGFAVVQFAEEVLEIGLYPWQKWLLIHALELREDNTLRFRNVVVLVARQNGKSTLSQVLALWFIYVYGFNLVLGTAQDLDTAEEIWQGAVDLVTEVDENDEPVRPELYDRMKRVVLNNGKKSLDIEPPRIPGRKKAKAARYKVKAANRRAGRGLSGDLILLDELREHQTWEAWGAITKDLPNSTPILKADGTWAEIGALAEGDQIFSPSGKPTRVTAVHPIRQLRPMYRVRTSDGRELVASESHLWTVKDSRRGYDLATGWETLTTAEILSRGLKRKAQEYAFRMPLQEALQDIPRKVLPIDPYLLGCWLGDGTSMDGTLTVGSEDLAETCAALADAGATVTTRIETRPGTWRVRLHVNDRPLRSLLAEHGLLGNKHVPDAYLTSSTEQRMALLQGLMDTDGCATKSGLAKFTSTREDLSDSVLFLARSLGWNARKSEFIPRIGGKDCGRAWNVVFTIRAGDDAPFRLTRKIQRCGRSDAPAKHVSIIAIEPVPTEPSTCIAVDSADRLFLAGRHLMPTHNTTMARAMAMVWALSNAGDASSVVLRHLRKQAHAELGDPDGLSEEDQPVEEDDDDLELADADDLAIFEWSAPPGCDVRDRAGWAMANPSLGHKTISGDGIHERTIASACKTDPEWVFRTEVLCQWSDGTLDGPFPAGSWESGRDEASKRAPDAPVKACVDVSWNRGTSHIAVAARREDGLPHIEIVASRAGTDWVIPWFTDETKPHRKTWPVVIQKGSPAASLIEPLTEAGVNVVEWGGADVPTACGTFYDLVAPQSDDDADDAEPLPSGVRHRPQPVLDLAAATAVTRPLGDAWAWDRKKSPHDAAPLVAVTGALWELLRAPEKPKRNPQIWAWPDETEAE